MSSSAAISGFPFGSILRNALKMSTACGAAFWIEEDRISAHFSRPLLQIRPEQLLETSGAPLLLAPVTKNSPFTTQILKPNNLEPDGRFAFVVEHPDTLISLVQTKNLSIGSLEELRSLPMETLLPTPTLPDSFCWNLFSPELETLPSSGDLPSSVVVVGLPQKICWWAEKWIEAVDGILFCICPGLLAILQWCRTRTPAFALLPRKGQSHLAVFYEEKLHLLIKMPSDDWLTGPIVEAMIEEIQHELQIPESPLCIYPSGSSNMNVDNIVKAFKKPYRILGPQSPPSIPLPDAEQSVLKHIYQSSCL